jgi:hypothetical protein
MKSRRRFLKFLGLAPVAIAIGDKVVKASVASSQVELGHVRLGNVGNFDVATQLEAESGTANNHYMTPVRAHALIKDLRAQPLRFFGEAEVRFM